MREQRILPFYMTYPLPLYYDEDREMLNDLEYLQQMYPAAAKKLQREIADYLRIMDYEGSMIYDQYPDQIMLYRLGNDILEKVRQKYNEAGQEDLMRVLLEWEKAEDLVILILFFEILKYRHRSGHGYLKF